MRDLVVTVLEQSNDVQTSQHFGLCEFKSILCWFQLEDLHASIFVNDRGFFEWIVLGCRFTLLSNK